VTVRALLRRVASIGLPAIAVAGLANLVVRTIAIHAGDVPSDLDALNPPAIVMGTIMPIVGNGGGFVAAYKHPARDGRPAKFKDHLLFFGPGAAFFTAAMTVMLLTLPDHASAVSVAAVVVANIVPTAVILPALHLLGHSQRHAPEPSPSPGHG
jgi:hypothetical protein